MRQSHQTHAWNLKLAIIESEPNYIQSNPTDLQESSAQEVSADAQLRQGVVITGGSVSLLFPEPGHSQSLPWSLVRNPEPK